MRVVVRWLRAGFYTVLSLDGATDQPLDEAFVGNWAACLRERNRRCESWSEVADEVSSGEMPSEGFW